MASDWDCRRVGVSEIIIDSEQLKIAIAGARLRLHMNFEWVESYL